MKTNSGPVQARRNVEAMQRARDALELRLCGQSLSEIAGLLGYAGPSGVAKAVGKAIAGIPAEPARQVRDLEVLRLDGMLYAISDKVNAGHLGAIDRALRIMERRAKLLGLDMQKDAPVQIQTGPGPTLISTGDMSQSERDEFLAALKLRRSDLAVMATIGHDGNDGLAGQF